MQPQYPAIFSLLAGICALIENLGGGRYRATATTAAGPTREFFRLKINES